MFDDTGIVIREINREGGEYPIQEDDKFVVNTDNGLQPAPLIPPDEAQSQDNTYQILSNDETKSNNSYVSAQQKYDP